MRNPTFVDGRVQFDDGTPPNPNIRIERVCGGNAHLQGRVDSHGNFSFQLGLNNEVDTDASSSSPGMSRSGTGYSGYGSGVGSGYPQSQQQNTFGCEIRASYPGYRAETFILPTRDSFETVHIGTMILHRLANVQGSTISATTALAPKKAQKAYEKAMQLSAKGKFEEATDHFQEATTLYPKYAIAWCALGEVQQRMGKTDDAHKSFASAIAADSHYVSPLNQLALMAGQEGKWEDSVEYSRQALSLNPVEFVSAYWYNAVGNYHLHKLSDAEKSAREVVKLDSTHQFPQAENMIANILLQKGDVTEAATHLRAYLTVAPKAEDAEQVKQLLAKLEAKNTPAPKP